MIARAELRRLNDILGQELGRNIYGDSVYTWRWSEDCFWPAMPTGKTIRQIITVPLIGGGEEATYMVVPEYTKSRQTNLDHKWLITKWLAPWELVSGIPNDPEVRTAWNNIFPGADFPARGWRIPVGGAWIPRGPEDPSEPNERDTRVFISIIKHQRSLTFEQGMAEWEAMQAERDNVTQKEIEDISRDAFPAFLNDKPGKRGGWISFPFTKFDRRN